VRDQIKCTTEQLKKDIRNYRYVPGQAYETRYHEAEASLTVAHLSKGRRYRYRDSRDKIFYIVLVIDVQYLGFLRYIGIVGLFYFFRNFRGRQVRFGTEQLRNYIAMFPGKRMRPDTTRRKSLFCCTPIKGRKRFRYPPHSFHFHFPHPIQLPVLLRCIYCM
jgi:hypothetical protein